MSSILISVIIPAFNCASYIKNAVESALKQTIPVEIIVIDDHSNDNLRQVLEEYILSNKIIYIRNEYNKGVSETRNIGVKAANGEYIAYLDADDWWSEDKLQKQLKLLLDKDCVLSYTSRKLVDDDGRFTGKMIHVEEYTDYHKLLYHNLIACSSVLIRRDVALQFPMCHDELHEDYLNWLTILKEYKKAYGIDEPLLMYRLSKGGKSRNKLKSAKMTYLVYRKIGFNKAKSCILMYSHLFHSFIKYHRCILTIFHSGHKD